MRALAIPTRPRLESGNLGWSVTDVGPRNAALLAMCVAVVACQDKEVDASSDEEAIEGEACANDPDADEGPACAEGLSCEPAGDPDADGKMDYVCGAPLEIRGNVFDALDGLAIEGALVSALDETGAPVSDVAVTDAGGHYVLEVSARRDQDGIIVDAIKWTLFVTAQDYQPFPAGVRPALPINAEDAVEEDEDDKIVQVIENPTTDAALLILPEDQRGGRTISGSVGGEHPGGTLVVAEGSTPAPYTIADASGEYTIFNVVTGSASVVGYRRGLSLRATTADSDGDQESVNLEVVAEGDDELATVDGSVNIVNAPGGSQTSVVLVPVSVYNEPLERGPVPFGLRAPEPPLTPAVDGAWSIRGVPPGQYKVLAAFENDDLVRDPDENIAGTDIPEITVGESSTNAGESFKITEHLEVVSPGAEVPEVVDAMPTFIFADDSSEDLYHVVVYDAFGDLVWEDPEVPRVTGNKNVEVPYGGPALTPGMYYQFRATSFKDGSAISRTEDLRGVFIAP